MGNNDDWMDNPIEMDDWIREMDEETKGIPPKGGGSPPGNGGCGSGCLIVVLGVLGLIVLITLITTSFKSSSYSTTRKSYTGAGTSTGKTSQRCGVAGCDNLHISGGGYRYCYLHTCETLRCKDKVVSGSKFCSKHQPSKYGNGGSNNNTSTKRNTTKKSNDEYNASD